MNRIGKVLAFAVTAFGLVTLRAEAVPLTIVNVAAPAINCVFNLSCTVGVTDSIGAFTPQGDSGAARLQSRTFSGVAPAPAAGDMSYMYRLDMTSVQSLAAGNCVTKLAVKFGRDVKLPYSAEGLYDVYVVTSGGLGSVGLSSAAQVGSTITFTFAGPVCPGATSFFFGVASQSTTPVAGVAKLRYSLGGSATTADRVP